MREREWMECRKEQQPQRKIKIVCTMLMRIFWYMTITIKLNQQQHTGNFYLKIDRNLA